MNNGLLSMLVFTVFVTGLLFSSNLRKGLIARVFLVIFIGQLLLALTVTPVNNIYYGKAETKLPAPMPTDDDDDDINPD